MSVPFVDIIVTRKRIQYAHQYYPVSEFVISLSLSQCLCVQLNVNCDGTKMNIFCMCCFLTIVLSLTTVCSTESSGPPCPLDVKKCVDQVALRSVNTIIDSGGDDVESSKQPLTSGDAVVPQHFDSDSSFRVKNNGHDGDDILNHQVKRQKVDDVELSFWRDVIAAIARDKLKKQVKRFKTYQLV